MHRFREFGAAVKEMDLLDESSLSSEQMRVVCSCVTAGGVASDLPHPDEDWGSFISAIKTRMKERGPTWNPLKKTDCDWINLESLAKVYRKEGSSVCSIS